MEENKNETNEQLGLICILLSAILGWLLGNAIFHQNIMEVLGNVFLKVDVNPSSVIQKLIDSPIVTGKQIGRAHV